MQNKNIEIYKTLTQDKYFGYKVKMALVLLSPQEAYDILEAENRQPMLREGEPSAIWQRILKDEIYETKAWYIPDHLKLWDKRFGSLFKRPFFAFDSDVEAWTDILEFYLKVSTPKAEHFPNRKIYNQEWQFFAELLAVAQKNNHPLCHKAENLLKERGLPEKVLEKKKAELEKYHCLEYTEIGIEHFCRTTKW
ncbi:hypothetical protein A4G20_08260 [Pasteurellaceae bacterium RH1A]|nr:hypothetical protein A4G20_08260 [Pasteurellaceae bacterium RH1A]